MKITSTEARAHILASSIPLVIVRGLPGSGKSTFAKTLDGFFHCEADQFFIRDGVYRFNGKLLGDAHKDCQGRARTALSKGNRVVVSNTFTQHWEVEPYLDMARTLGKGVQVITMLGQFPNVHGVLQDAMVRMCIRWEPISNEWLVTPVVENHGV